MSATMCNDSWNSWIDNWQAPIESWIATEMAASDPGHDLQHVRRVVLNASHLGQQEQANPNVIFPAAWLHDCVSVPKNSLQRSQASRLAAAEGVRFLKSINYPSSFLGEIEHAIEAHSFSADLRCETLEAKIVQDADRLEALGAIGIARCLMTGGSLHHRLYDPAEPFPLTRPADDSKQSVDHFFVKLLRLPKTFQTAAGEEVARQRIAIMEAFLLELANELGCDLRDVKAEIVRCGG